MAAFPRGLQVALGKLKRQLHADRTPTEGVGSEVLRPMAWMGFHTVDGKKCLSKEAAHVCLTIRRQHRVGPDTCGSTGERQRQGLKNEKSLSNVKC